MGGLKNRNGCPVPSTFFVTCADTVPAAVQSLYLAGNEVATHTTNHVGNPGAQEIVGCRDWLANKTGIPRAKLSGFRCGWSTPAPVRACDAQLAEAGLPRLAGGASSSPPPRTHHHPHAPSEPPPARSHCRRAPFLLHNTATRAALAAAGFQYDSSIPDTVPSLISPSVQRRSWPYKMDAGIVQRCDTGRQGFVDFVG